MAFWKKASRSRQKKNGVKCRVIGVMGTGRAVGTTHLCLMMANYLTGARQRKTAVIEWNSHQDFVKMGRICSRHGRVASENPGEIFQILGVTYYGQGNAGVLTSCLEGSYEEVIIDFGEANDLVWEEWLRCSVKILMVSFSEWQLERAFKVLEQGIHCKRSWIYLAAFGSEKTRKEIARRLGIPLRRIPFSADAFLIDYPLIQLFEQLL